MQDEEILSLFVQHPQRVHSVDERLMLFVHLADIESYRAASQGR